MKLQPAKLSPQCGAPSECERFKNKDKFTTRVGNALWTWRLFISWWGWRGALLWPLYDWPAARVVLRLEPEESPIDHTNA